MGRPPDEEREALALQHALDAARNVGLDVRPNADSTLVHWSRKSLVVRLTPAFGEPIVAKRVSVTRATHEIHIYEHFLSRWGEGHVHLLAGLADAEFGWLFLEDGGERQMVRHDPTDRYQLGALLGRLASFGRTVAGEELEIPQLLLHDHRLVLERVSERLSDEIRLGQDPHRSQVLMDAHARLSRLTSVWPKLSHYLDTVPPTVCHADVVPKNIRRQTGDSALVLLDWELAVRADVALDLGCMGVSGADDPLLLGFGSTDPGEDRPLFLIATLGRLLRMVRAMDWATKDLGTRSDDRGIGLIERYCAHTDRAMAALQ